MLVAAGAALGACGGSAEDSAGESAPVSASSTATAPEPTTVATDAATTTAVPDPTTTAVPDPTTTAAPTTVESTTTTAAPATGSEIVINVPARYPEGLTYGPDGGRFIVGSLLGGQLLAVDDDGATAPVTESPGSNLTGIEADPERNRLLVAVTGLPFGTAQLSVHDLTSGEQVQLVDFASVQPDDRRFANGIAVEDEGNIYVTDTGAGVIYVVDSSYTPSVFATNDELEPDRTGPTASGLNGVVLVGDALIVGHAPSGRLLRVPLSDPNQVEVVPTGVDGMRIDGLHVSDNGSLLAMVSNFGSVHLFESVDDWSTASEVERFELGDSFPPA